jgi:glutathione synthase/RimK-type ligase-like ATP-grasp enzyme
MTKVLIVVDRLEDWGPYHPSEQVITFEQYLGLKDPDHKLRVINLCKEYDYLREGYYCSLLAEARGHHVIPSVKLLTDASSIILYQLNIKEIFEALDRLFKKNSITKEITIKSYFGEVSEVSLKPLARYLFERFPCPIIELTLRKIGNNWEIPAFKLVNHTTLTDNEQDAFSQALDHFTRDVWRPKKARKSSRYDLAILANPEEKMPPSNPAALKKFVHAGKNLGVNVDIITPNDLPKLPNYDALFIRETTSLEHHTYRFALKGEAAGLVVIDDATSILRCTNKIYLANLFDAHGVPTPKTLILQRERPEQLQQAINSLGLPMVIKIPNGSFSRGVVKVSSLTELEEKVRPLFSESSLLLAQEFLYTDFDWRIGILNNKPLYACRYFMVKNHWQIYRHSENDGKAASGGFETLPTFEVPRNILQAALRATKPIGNGFYGVDIKESGGKGYVIEVNDNPSIETAVEDRYLGNELYSLIMQEFVRRIEER